MDKKIVNFIHISMRISIELGSGGADTDLLFWIVLTVFELGYLPVRGLRIRRVLSTVWDRRVELLGLILSAARGRGSGLRRMAGSLGRSPA